MMKPLIGITSYYVKSYEMGTNRVRGLKGQNMVMTTMDYVRSITEAGGMPVVIPLVDDNDYIDELTEKLDGLLFTGGPDLSPVYFNDYPRIGLGDTVPERDEFEFKLLEKSLEKNKSILGICRGTQIISCYFGGTLYQDIKSSNISEIDHAATNQPKYFENHSIKILKNSRLYQVFEKEEISVNSFHHQCINKLGDGLTKVAWAEDGIIEAYEKIEYPFLMCVQWHPEMMSDKRKEQMKIFNYFIKNL